MYNLKTNLLAVSSYFDLWFDVNNKYKCVLSGKETW
jgi:hypothetical protein